MCWPCWSLRSKSSAGARSQSVIASSCQPPAGTGPSAPLLPGCAVLLRGGPVLVVLREVLLQDLAGGVAGKLVEEHDLPRNLVAREVVLDVLLEGVLVDVALLHDERP